MKLLYIPFIMSILAAGIGCSKNEPVATTHGAIDEENSIQIFTSLPSSETGITFNNEVVENSTRHYSNFNPIYDGGGVATGDINNDGLPDLYFTGNEVDNKLYINKGEFQFEDITDKAGVAAKGGWKNGVSLVDINQDGWLDIYVCKGGYITDPTQRKNVLFINKGNLTFSEEAEKYGLADAGHSFQSAFFDYDNDNDLDVFVINHPNKTNLSIQEYVEGRENASVYHKCRMYENNGNNTFTDVTDKAGMSKTFAYGLSVSTADLDGNGYLDVYVSNDYLAPDYFFLNNGNKTFTESVKERTGHISFFSMGVDIADVDNNGWEDLFVSEMLPEDYKRSKINMASMNVPLFTSMVDNGFHHCYMHNVMQLNRGNGFFTDVSQMAGVAKTDWSWACFMSDFDNDGLRDVFVANGYRRDLFDKDAIKKMNDYFKANQGKISDINEVMNLYNSEKLISYVYKNYGEMNFTKMSQAWGLHQASFSNGAAIADMDNDGDLDLVVNNMNQEASVYRNNAEQTGHHYLQVRLRGPATNLQGLGAKVWITYDNGKKQMEQLKLNRGYLGTVEPVVHFGLGKITAVDELKVEWLDGKVNILANPKMDSEVVVQYKDAAQSPAKEKAETLMSEITQKAFKQPFVHTENVYDDFQKQILLPHRQSRNGPFIAVGDVNGDKLEDFYVGGAAGQAGALYIQDKAGTFVLKEVKAFNDDKGYEDMGVLLFDADQDADQDLYVVSGGFEFPENSDYYQDRLYFNDGNGNFSKSNNLPNTTSSGSCVAASDIDGDGDLDLFVGGRVVPDKYPYPPQSYILINEKGKFTDKTSEWAPDLANVGMVTSALWNDVDGDQKADLVLTGEWLPLLIYKNNNGKLTNISGNHITSPNTGWWNTIAAYDIDQDGDMDFLGGNVGLNYKFSASAEKPFQVYCDDMDKNGSYDVVLAKYLGKDQVPIRGRECMSQQMPYVAEKFKTYHDFAEAKLPDIVGDNMKTSLTYKTDWFASSFIINDNGNFRISKMPYEAQFSSVNGILMEDFDGDGDQDILIAGNMYGSEVETTRGDGSFGLLLTQEGNNTYAQKGYIETGFFVPYDVKDVKLIHLGSDHQIGILVGSNNSPLRLFKVNTSQKEI